MIQGIQSVACEPVLLNVFLYIQLSRRIRCHLDENNVFQLYLKHHETSSMFLLKWLFQGGKPPKSQVSQLLRGCHPGSQCVPLCRDHWWGPTRCRELPCPIRMGTSSISCRKIMSRMFSLFVPSAASHNPLDCHPCFQNLAMLSHCCLIAAFGSAYSPHQL